MLEFAYKRLFTDGIQKRYVNVTPLIYKDKIVEEFYLDSKGDIYSSRNKLVKNLDNTVIKCKYTIRAKYPCMVYRERITTIMKRLSVHIAVASTFHPIHKLDEIRGVPDNILKLAKTDNETLMFLYNTLQVNHINHIKHDYSPTNLEWVTARANIDCYQEHAYEVKYDNDQNHRRYSRKVL